MLGWNPAHRHVLFPAPESRAEKRYDLAQAAVARLDPAFGPCELHSLDGIPHEEVPTWLNAAEVVLLTSSREGSPNAIKEALSCNVPVVSVDVGDVRERIEGVAGCFIAAATPADLAEKLGRVLEAGERIDAREQVADLAIERVAEKLRTIYVTLTN